METSGQTPSRKGTLPIVVTAAAFAGIALMGVPCHSDGGSGDSGGSDPVRIVTAEFVPSNVRVDNSIAAAEATTLSLDGFDGTFVFVGGQRWIEYEGGSARLVSEIADAGDRTRRFDLVLDASGRTNGTGIREEMLDLGLEPDAYASNGGSVDPSAWVVFGTLTGTLTGKEALDGTDLTLDLAPDGVLQIGEGANNANVYYGAFASLVWRRVGGVDPASDEADSGDGSVSFTLQADTVARASAAQSTEPYHGSGHRHAVTLPGIANRLLFAAGGLFTERPDGTARLSGVLVEDGNPARSFHIDVRLAGRIDLDEDTGAPSGSPKLELNDSAYAENGGPVDPDTWRYYEEFGGTLIGLGELHGAELTVERRGPAFQVGVGASGKNANQGAAGWLDTVVVTQPDSGPPLSASTGGDINIDLSFDGTTACALPAQKDDAVARYSGGHAYWLPGLARDLVFEPGATFTERADGSARLDGVIYSLADPTLRFVTSVDLADRIDPQAPGHAPPGSPKLELQSSAYVANGGSVDPAGWHYYGTTNGVLNGLGRMRGAQIRIDRRGPAFQVGLGASGKNTRYGACGWLNVTVESDPDVGPALPEDLSYGDINIDLSDECALCAIAAERDPAVATYQGNHAFYLPGISHDFVFERGASFVESSDGTATLAGSIVSPSRDGWCFDVVVELSDRVDPTDGAYPPAGSPKKELVPSSFVEQGGPIDTNSWRYYESFSGRLTGKGELDGAIVDIARFGPPFQIGRGADGKNHGYGGAGWLEVELVEQPTTGIALPGVLERGDINVDFTDGCVECALGAVRDPAVTRLPGTGAFYFGGLGSDWFHFEGPGEFTERADGTAALRGILVDVEGGDQRWAVDLEFDGLADTARGDALPADSPKRDLKNGQFIDQGGTVDFMQWRYYQSTEGVLIGLGQHEGARVRLWRMGPAFQVGAGASGANLAYGASGWLHVDVESQPTAGPVVSISSGDFNVDLDAGCDLCAKEARLDSEATTTSGDHSFYFPGIGTDFVFVGPAPFVERADGTARLSGVIERPNEPGKRFRVEVDFWGRSDPGMAGYPPAGSPKLELRSPYYMERGGPVDPTAWRYYESFEGRAFGLAEFEGGELYFTRMGEAFQIGNGASGKNVDFGASCWLDLVIVANPTTGAPFSIPEGLHGDLNIDFQTGCE